MKIFLTCLILTLTFFTVSAQQDRFIYLQTESQTPFFVKLNNKIYNSYASGYLIIPKLDEGNYNLIIGFPESTNELEFNCSIEKRDIGFIIKKEGENRWQLVSVQTQAVIVPGDVITKPVIVYEKVTDPFSTMLANAVHDSTILRKDVVKEILIDKPVAITDTSGVIVSNNDAIIKQDSILLIDSANRDAVKKLMRDQKDTSDNFKVDIAKVSDSTKKDSSVAFISEKNKDLNKKDTVSTIAPIDIIISNPDSILKTDVSIPVEVTKEKATVISPQDTLSKEQVVTKSKKRKSRKADNPLKTDATIPELINEKTPLITKDDSIVITSNNEVATRSKKRKSKKAVNTLRDSLMEQKEIVKIIPDKINENRDSLQSQNLNSDLSLLKSVIKRKSKKTNKDGMELMYIDDLGDIKDTIRILIPSEKKKRKAEDIKTDQAIVTNDPNKRAEHVISKEEKEIIKEANKDAAVKSIMINSDCKNFATDADFLKIRKKMVAEDNDEDMIKAARKIFKIKCFTTEQIKNLSVLFLKDENKYMFFDAAYPFVSDSDLFPALEKQLTDNYFITRFRAMVNK